MNGRSRIASVVLMALAIALPARAETPVTVRTSHRSAVTALAWMPNAELLVSAGADGKLKVWNPDRGSLVQSIRADRLPIRSLAVYPDEQRVAVYSAEGGEHRISVWDWQEGTREFLHTVDDEVLTLAISPGGSYLIYTTPRLRSVMILDARSGRELPFLRRNTGIVSWVVPSTSEERLMTYSPATGDLVYYTIVSGDVAARFSAPPDLTNPVLLENRRYAAVRTGDGMLAIIDLLSGRTVDTTVAGEIEAMAANSDRSEISVTSRSFRGTPTVRGYRLENGEIRDTFGPRRELPEEWVTQLSVGRDLFVGLETGEIRRWLPFESRSASFARDLLEPVSDILVVEERLHMVTDGRIITIESDFLTLDPSDRGDTTYVTHRWWPFEDGAEARFLVASDGDAVLWRRGEEGTLGLFRERFGGITPLDLELPRSLQSVDVTEAGVVVLSRAGELRVYDRESGETSFTYRGLGLQHAIDTSRGILVGRAATGVLDAAILRVNPRTGETVPIDSESRLVFRLTFDERRGRLYALGVQQRRGEPPQTVIEVFDGANLNRRRAILTVEGEYLEAEVVVDPQSGVIYTTLDDRGGILRWDGSRTTELVRDSAHIPRRLRLTDNYLLSLNYDGTVSVFDRRTRMRVLEIYALRNPRGGWIALQPDGGIYLSDSHPALRDAISLNRPGMRLERQLLAPAGSNGRPAPSAPTRHEGAEPEGENQRERFDPFSGEIAPSS